MTQTNTWANGWNTVCWDHGATVLDIDEENEVNARFTLKISEGIDKDKKEKAGGGSRSEVLLLISGGRQAATMKSSHSRTVLGKHIFHLYCQPKDTQKLWEVQDQCLGTMWGQRHWSLEIPHSHSP